MTKLFYDLEFTGLHKDTTPISLGIVAATGKEFYAEFTDYDRTMVDDWIQAHVIENLMFNNENPFSQTIGSGTFVKGTTADIRKALLSWLQPFKRVEFWSDVLAYDNVIMNDLIGVLDQVPKNVDYIHYDIATVLKLCGIDPDISREAFIDKPIIGTKHNALYDARVIEACYEKLKRNQNDYGFFL